jgi:pilus assembly protein CpaF
VSMLNSKPLLAESERIIKSTLASLADYFADESVNEIMINNPDVVFIERAGKMERLPVRFTDMQIETVLHAVARINTKELSSIMDARLPGLRIAAALPPVAIHGPMIVIRKHATRRFKLEEYVASGAFNILTAADIGVDHTSAVQARMEAGAANGGQGLADFMRWAIRAHKNCLLVGGTSSGKTTLLSSCLIEIPHYERIITCEDTHEIALDEHPNLVQLEALHQEDPNKSITIRQLIRLCLRSRPDRIIVGEIRGPEAYDFLDSMNTGHSGALCTLHADSAFQGLARLESLIRMSPTAANFPLRDMRKEIASAIHYVIYQSRAGGRRAPQEVLALEGVDEEGQYKSRLIFNRIGEI